MTDLDWHCHVQDWQRLREMLEQLGPVSDRRLRLFACACFRRAWYCLPAYEQRALALAEARIDSRKPLAPKFRYTRFIWHKDAFQAASHASWLAHALWFDAEKPSTDTEWESQAVLLRDIVGNPFEMVPIEQAWRTEAVQDLARAAYQDRLMPSGELDPAMVLRLAAALEQAGATEEALAHLRDGPHFRGCWVVDGCLGLR